MATPRCVTSSPAEGGSEPTPRIARKAVVREKSDERKIAAVRVAMLWVLAAHIHGKPTAPIVAFRTHALHGSGSDLTCPQSMYDSPMADEPFYSPNRKPPASPQRRTGEPLWSLASLLLTVLGSAFGAGS